MSVQELLRAAAQKMDDAAKPTNDVKYSRAINESMDENTGLPMNADGTVTVYHHTSKASADSIRKTGMLKAQAEPDVYATTRKETDTGYGDTAVAIRVNPERLTIDDEFPNGRKDFRLNVGKPGGSVRVAVENEFPAPNQDDATKLMRDSSSAPTIPASVFIANGLGAAKRIAGYEDAKTGNVAAAMEVASQLLSDAQIQQIGRMIGDAVILPVVNVEDGKDNRIPQAAATLIAKRLGKQISTEVLRKTPDSRTKMDGISRIFSNPEFFGDVVAGQSYFLIDDTITQGGTLATLSRYITDNGGVVQGAAVLTGQERSEILAITDTTLAQVKETLGNAERNYTRATGKDFTELTESEGKFILANAVRFGDEAVARANGSSADSNESTVREKVQNNNKFA